MNIVIFEDDGGFAADIREWVSSRFSHNIYMYQREKDILQYIANNREPTLYLLDIVIANTAAGLKIGERVGTEDGLGAVVYITQYPNRIITKTIHKVLSFNTIVKQSPTFYDELKETIVLAENEFDKMILSFDDKANYINIPISTICFATTLKQTRRIIIFCKDGARYIVHGSLRWLEGKVTVPWLMRCHRLFIVNVRNIRVINKQSKSIQCEGHPELCYYSKSKQTKLYSLCKQYGTLHID